MHGHNALFLANPINYLNQNAIECYNTTGGAMNTAITGAGGIAGAQTCNVTMEFDLVPQPGNYVSLRILGAVGAYAATRRYGRPIVARWMPYLGQKALPEEPKIGYIDLNTVPVNVNYVFTAGLGGCNFVVRDIGAIRRVYHEPTAAEWGVAVPAYPGLQVLTAGPAYTALALGGFSMIRRRPGGWQMVFQLIQGVNVVAVTTHNI